MDLLTLSLGSLFGGGTAANGEGATGANPMSLIIMVAMFALMYFFMIRPQKKKQKEEQEMRDSIQIGDEITTIGGIIGRVVTVKDDSIVIETGTDRTKLKMQRWAIQTNETANARMAAEKKAAEDAKKAQSEKAAIDQAVNGKKKKTKTVENKGAVEELKAEEEAQKADEE
jgi:preprotein translocase subunit YajC